MNIQKLTLGLYQTNIYILSNDTEAVVIDPGYEPDTILDALEGKELKAILLTHGHFDHVGAVKELVAETGCEVWIHAAEATMPPMVTAGPLYFTHTYDEGDTVSPIAGLELTVDPDFEKARREDVYQIMLGCREADHPAIIRDAAGADITFSWDRAADVIPAGSGKAQAILKVLEYYHLKPAQAMAFGDGCNDIEMLQTVGTGVAMGNGSEELKAAANAVCRPVTEDGIYHFCLERGLIAPYTKGDTGC